MTQNNEDRKQVTSFSIENTCRSTNYLKNLKAIIETHPDNSAKILGESIIWMIMGKTDEMIESYRRLINDHPDIALLHRRAGELRICQKQYADAIPYFDRAVELDEHDLTSRFWRSFCHFKNNDLEGVKFELEYLEERVIYLNTIESNWF